MRRCISSHRPGPDDRENQRKPRPWEPIARSLLAPWGLAAALLIVTLGLPGCERGDRAIPLEACPAPVSVGAIDNRVANRTGFLFFGDTGESTPEQGRVATAMANFCATETCELVALLGDNIYPSGVRSVDDPQWEAKFERAYRGLGIPFYAALGNHDRLGSILAQIGRSARSARWKMPSCLYTFRDDETEFFVLDTDRFDEAQRDWLSAELARSQRDRAVRWRVVYGHHPIYSYGSHGDTEVLKRLLLPALRDRADFYLSGHDHDRQVLDAERGVTFVVSGAAAVRRNERRGPRTLFAASTYGFAHLDIRGRQAVLRLIDEAGTVNFRRAYNK